MLKKIERKFNFYKENNFFLQIHKEFLKIIENLFRQFFVL